MATYRVLWTDSELANEGRWQDVDAGDEANATWQAALTAGPNSKFLAVALMPPASD